MFTNPFANATSSTSSSISSNAVPFTNLGGGGSGDQLRRSSLVAAATQASARLGGSTISSRSIDPLSNKSSTMSHPHSADASMVLGKSTRRPSSTATATATATTDDSTAKTESTASPSHSGTLYSSAGGITFISPFNTSPSTSQQRSSTFSPTSISNSVSDEQRDQQATKMPPSNSNSPSPSRVSISIGQRKASIISTGSSSHSRSKSRASSGDFTNLISSYHQHRESQASVLPGSPGSRRASMGGTSSPMRSPSIHMNHNQQTYFAQLNDAPSGSGSPGGTGGGASNFPGRHHVDFMRRRSVDVGVLGVGMHRNHGTGAVSRRLKEAVGPDAGDKEFGLVGGGVKGAKDRLLGRHLASLLAHSLSLCHEPTSASANEDDLSRRASEDNEQEIEPTKVALPAIPGSPASSPNASRNTSVSTDSVSFSAAGSSLSGEGFDAPTSAPVPPLRPAAPVSSFPVISEAKRSKLIVNLQSWSFNAMSFASDDLLSCVGLMFEGVRNMEGVDFDLGQFKTLLLLLRSAYHSRNGYHNFSHATDVTQACYSFLVRMGLAPPLYLLGEEDYDANLGEGRRKWRRNRAVEESGMAELLRPMDVFALMVAAIGHDVGHPGLSNAYMVNARTPVAQVYEDKSVLENFHTVTLIHMLRRCNFDYLLGGDFGHLGQNATDFRKVLEASILATDMSRHFTFVNEINEMGRRFGERRGSAPGTIESDRLLLCSGLMKCADISNPTRPHRISRAWSTALLEEWSVQASIETQFGLPISVMTIDTSDTKAQAKSQVGFIDLFAKPLFNAMAGVVDEFADFAEKLRDGRTAWEAISLQTDAAFRQPAAQPFKLSAVPAGRSHSRDSSNNRLSGGEEESPTTPRMNSEAKASRDATPCPTPQAETVSSSSLTLRSDPIGRVSTTTTASPATSSSPARNRPTPTPIRPNYHSRHIRGYSGGSSSSTNASPLSPLFPGSVSSVATGTSLSAATPSENGSLFSPHRGIPPQLAAELAIPFKSSCGGACTVATAMCEVCAQKENPTFRRGSLGQVLTGIERRQAAEEEWAEDDVDVDTLGVEIDNKDGDLNSVWPPFPFMPTRIPAASTTVLAT